MKWLERVDEMELNEEQDREIEKLDIQLAKLTQTMGKVIPILGE